MAPVFGVFIDIRGGHRRRRKAAFVDVVILAFAACFALAAVYIKLKSLPIIIVTR